jgi:predicted transcriptional regulator
MKILLSIKPEYTEKIFSGEKKYEFRKKKPKESFEMIFIYESHPTKNIVGWFTVKKIMSDSPEIIWKKCKNKGGINRENFFAYCKDLDIIHALEIDKTFQFDFPIDPYKINSSFKPPQNFAYIDNLKLMKTLETRDINECFSIRLNP